MTTPTIDDLRNKFKAKVVEPGAEKDKNAEDSRKSVTIGLGSNVFRPIAFDDEEIVKELDVHFLGIPFICPKMQGKSCASCDFGWSMWKENGNAHVVQKDAKGFDRGSKSYLSQKKMVIRGIDRRKEKEDFEKYKHPLIRWLDLSPTVGKKVKSYQSTATRAKWADEDSGYDGDIFDIQRGKDIDFVKTPPASKDAYPEISPDIIPKSKPFIEVLSSKAPDYVEVFLKMLETAPKLEDRYPVKTPDEVIALLNAHLGKMKDKVEEGEGEGETQHEAKFEAESPEFAKSREDLDSSKKVSIDSVIDDD